MNECQVLGHLFYLKERLWCIFYNVKMITRSVTGYYKNHFCPLSEMDLQGNTGVFYPFLSRGILTFSTMVSLPLFKVYLVCDLQNDKKVQIPHTFDFLWDHSYRSFQIFIMYFICIS